MKITPQLRRLLLSFTIVCISTNVFASVTDNLYMQMCINYNKEFSKGNKFVASIFYSAQTTLSRSNPQFLLVIKNFHIKDTATLRAVHNAVVARFINEQPMTIEEAKYDSTFKDVIVLSNEILCRCLTDKVLNINENIEPISNNYPIFMDECTQELFKNQEYLLFVKERVKDPKYLMSGIKRFMMAMAKNCPTYQSIIINASYVGVLDNLFRNTPKKRKHRK